MAQSVVKTSTEGMQQAGQAFADTASDFTSRLQSINTEMATLQSTWTGSASTAFNSAMDAWEASFQKVINELLGMLESMGVNTNEYVSAEDTAANTAQSFANVLPGF
jgi:WXG100 family type VII secretion target